MPDPDRPNVLLLITDQQSATMLSCGGNPYLSTPAMDSLSATGRRFERAYCTNPVCMPSRFSLMTGRMPSAIGLGDDNNSYTGEVPAAACQNGLGNLMRAGGYTAAYGGKVHLPRMAPPDLGFDVISTDCRGGLAQACASYIRTPRKQPFCLVASFINPHDICYMAIRDFGVSEYRQRMLANAGAELAALDEALQFPAGLPRDEFFDHVCPPLPPNVEPPPEEPEAIRQAVAQSDFRGRARWEWPDERWRLHRWAYCRLVERVDAHIGRVLATLRDTGQAANTVVILTSDHGDHDGAHRLEHKGLHYEECCRVPLLIADLNAPTTGAVDDAHLVSNGLDVLPTICDYAGVAPPAGLPGASLRPLVEGCAITDWREAVPIEYSLGRSLVTRRYKYVRYNVGENRELLIDRELDPGEMRHAAADPAYQEILSDLRRRSEALK